MKRMIIFLFLLFSLPALTVWSQAGDTTAAGSTESSAVLDWGGFIDSSSEIEGSPETAFDQELKVGLWFDARYSDGFGLYGRTSYRYTEGRPYFADIDSLYAGGRILLEDGGEAGEGRPALLRYSAGRIRFREFTGYVLNHSLDGFLVGFEHPSFSLEGGAGYTGLTFVPSSNILVTQSDLLVQADAPESGYGLASPKVIETFKMSFPALLYEQELILNVVAQQDLQKEEDLAAEDGRIHTEHIGFGLRGGLAPSLYQNLYFYLNLGQGQYDTLAFLFGGALRYYNKDFYYSRIELTGLYSSGDNDNGGFYGGYTGEGSSSHFIALSSAPEFGLVFSPKIGNISILGLSLSMRPLSDTGITFQENLQVKLSVFSFFRNSGGAISEGGVNASSDENYLGTEFDLVHRMRITSDLGLLFGFGFFLPNNHEADSAMDSSIDAIQGAGRLQLSFSY